MDDIIALRYCNMSESLHVATAAINTPQDRSSCSSFGQSSVESIKFEMIHTLVLIAAVSNISTAG